MKGVLKNRKKKHPLKVETLNYKMVAMDDF